MNTKNNRKPQNTINLLLLLTALSVLMLGCSSSNTPTNNASPSPTPTPTQAPSPTATASPTPTPKNLAEAFYGEWETKDNTTGNFITVKFGPATQKGDDYVGTLTDVNTKQNLVEYTVKPNNNVTYLYLPGNTIAAGTSKTFEYEVSGDGNTLTIKSNPPEVFRKGTTSADIVKDVNTITIGGDWKMDDKTISSLNKQYGGFFPVNPTVIKFLPGQQVDAGYTGQMIFYQNYSTELKDMEPSKYIITSKNNIKINLHGDGEKAAKYTLLGDNVLRIEFSNGDPAINLTR